MTSPLTGFGTHGRPDGMFPIVGRIVFNPSKVSMLKLLRGTARTLVREVLVVNVSWNPRICMVCKRSGHTQIRAMVGIEGHDMSWDLRSDGRRNDRKRMLDVKIDDAK